MTIGLTLYLVATHIRKKRSNEPTSAESTTRALAVMVCVQTITILVLDSVELILSSIFNAYPNMSECKAYADQLADFDNYPPHLYSEIVINALNNMRIGCYFFPALVFDRTFRRALKEALVGGNEVADPAAIEMASQPD